MQRRPFFALAASAALVLGLGLAPGAWAQTKTLRVVPHANVTILDPVWTTAFVTRNHGYMIYDTLFGTDLEGRVKPQMVETFSASKDNKVWTFTLRDGLEFHDGKPVTSEDVVASLKRWSSRDSFGGVMARSLDSYETPNAKTFIVRFKQPFGVMLEALGKPSSNVPFIMPARIAATPGSEQIKEYIGSGPYKFVTADYKPGEKLVYVKNDKYKPRTEAPNGTTGGKVVYTDRVEWIVIRDPQTQFNALIAGEVDIIEQPAFEQYASLKAAKDVQIVDAQPAGLQYIFRFNHLHAPFDNVKIRQAAMVAMGQEAFLKTQVGAPGMFKYCKSIFPCGTPYASENTGIYTGMANPAKAKQMLADAGYKGEPIVLMRPTDLASIAKLPLVAKQQLEAAGFKVDMQQSDWATLVARRAKKDPPAAGGWNAFLTAWVTADVMNPISTAYVNAACDKASFGWPCDEKLEKLRDDFARETDPAKQKAIAEAVQLRVIEYTPEIPVGEYVQPVAMRKNVKGFLTSPAPVLWNVEITK